MHKQSQNWSGVQYLLKENVLGAKQSFDETKNCRDIFNCDYISCVTTCLSYKRIHESRDRYLIILYITTEIMESVKGKAFKNFKKSCVNM